ncbi:MAG: GTP-binding protein [Clostridia bacterium]|nr:GTP-binding protein [Clostridia bacterium]
MISVDIISGFLGSGKTTLIKQLVKKDHFKERVVIIENEFGEVGIDGLILRESNVAVKELNSGCICCTIVREFEKSIKEVIEQFKPERIIIEPSGVGKLSEVIRTFEIAELKEMVKIDKVITVVDVFNCELYLENFGEFFGNQIQHAKTVFLSRTQVATQIQIEETIHAIRGLNTQAHIVTTALENLKSQELSGRHMLQMVCADGCGCHHHSRQDHHHHADEFFEVWGTETKKVFTESVLRKILVTLSREEDFGLVLRGKGVLKVEDDVWTQFDYIPGEINISGMTSSEIGKICIIGRKLNRVHLEKLFCEQV